MRDEPIDAITNNAADQEPIWGMVPQPPDPEIDYVVGRWRPACIREGVTYYRHPETERWQVAPPDTAASFVYWRGRQWRPWTSAAVAAGVDPFDPNAAGSDLARDYVEVRAKSGAVLGAAAISPGRYLAWWASPGTQESSGPGFVPPGADEPAPDAKSAARDMLGWLREDRTISRREYRQYVRLLNKAVPVVSPPQVRTLADDRRPSAAQQVPDQTLRHQRRRQIENVAQAEPARPEPPTLNM